MNKEKVSFYGTVWCPDCIRVKHLLGKYGVSYEYIDVDKDSDAAKYLEQKAHGVRGLPTLIINDTTVLVEPDDNAVVEALGLAESPESTFSDVLIVGGGPAGITAAIFTSWNGVKTTVLEKNSIGGIANMIDVIDNFPGFPEGIKGTDLSQRLQSQATRFGTEIICADVLNIKENGMYKEVITSEGIYRAKAVLLTTGSHYITLGIPKEKELTNKGVHYCGPCVAPFYKDKEIAIVGGGNGAFENILHLSHYAKSITVLIRGEEIIASETLQARVKKLGEKVTIKMNHEVIECHGESELHSLTIKNFEDTTTHILSVSGLFVFAGQKPNTEFLKDTLVELDERGFIKTSHHLETSMNGVFAAGNCRSGATAHLTAAAGEGNTVALMISGYLDTQ